MGCKLSKLCANSEEEHDSYEPVRIFGEAATGSRPNRQKTPTRIITPADLDKSSGRSGSAATTARATDTPISTSNHEPKLRDDLDSSLVDPASAGSIPTNPELPDGITNEPSRSSTTPFICSPDPPATEASVSSSNTMVPPEPPTIPSNLEPQFKGEELLAASVAGEATLIGATGGNYSAARTSGFAISGLIHTAATTTTNTGGTGVLGGPISPAAQSFSSPTDQKPLTLWEQALNKVPQESIIYPGGRAVPVGGLAQNLIDEVERKKLECDSKRWFYNKNDNKVFIVETLLVQLNKYAIIGDVMIQHNPDIVALVWGGFRGLLQVGTAYVDQMRSVSENVDYLVQLLCSCQIYEKLYCQETLGISENLTKSLVDLYASILKFLCYTNQYLDYNTLARIFKSFSQEMGRLLAEIKSHKERVEENINIAEREVSSSSRFNQEKGFVAMQSLLKKIQEPLGDLRHVTELIYTTVETDRRLKILGWLSKVEYEGHHILSQRRRQDGTGSWLFKNDAFVRWSGSEKNSILWLRADAGFGKTILASTIVDDLEYQSGSDDHVVAYFYCNYKEPDRRDAASVLRTLVKQFCVKKEDQKVPTLIDELYKAREKRDHANGPLSPEENTELIINLSERYQSTTLIVDALDECDVGTRKSLFSSLHKIVLRATRVKIVVTSRYDDDINDSFSSGLCHCIDDKDNSADINLYVDAELDRRCDPQNAHDYELLLKGKVDPELKALIRLRLKERSNGMFMWVNLQINALCAARTVGGVKEALDRMPGTLNETYQQVLERIKSQDQNSHRVATIVLKWLLCAQEACTAGSVIQALAIDPGNAELNQDGLTWTIPGILGICKSLVVHDESLGIFRFAHFSVQEFLVVDPGFGRESSNAYVAGVCLTALLYHHGEASSITELYAYAMRYWGDHVRLSGATPGDLESLCMDFFKSSVAYKQWGSSVATNTFHFLRQLAGENITIVRPLFVASFYGLPDLCRLLLAGPENVLNSVNVDGQSPLIFSSLRNHEQVAKLLLERGDIDVNLADKKGKTALYRAASHGHDSIVHMLLEKRDVDVNAKSNMDKTPLLRAAQQGHDKVVQLLLEREDVDVNSKDNEYGQSPLSYAAENGHDKVVQLLLEREDVDVDSKDSGSGQSPLSWAAQQGHDKVVQLLLEREDVDVNSKDSRWGQSPLCWAAERGHDNVVRLLLEREGVDVNSGDGVTGRSPLSWAAEKGHDKVVRLLLEREGVDVNSRDGVSGRSPLCSAAESGHDKVVRLLLERGDIDVNLADKKGKTALYRAASHGHDTRVHMLLEKRDVDVNAKSNKDKTPLLEAAKRGHDKVVQLLLEREDVDVNLKDSGWGRSPLSWAAEGGHDKVVRLLLEREDVDVNSEDIRGRTALHHAQTCGRARVVKLLEAKVANARSPPSAAPPAPGDELSSFDE